MSNKRIIKVYDDYRHLTISSRNVPHSQSFQPSFPKDIGRYNVLPGCTSASGLISITWNFPSLIICLSLVIITSLTYTVEVPKERIVATWSSINVINGDSYNEPDTMYNVIS